MHQVLNRLREEIKLQTEDIKNDSDSEIAKSLKSNSNLSTSKPYATTKSPISGIEGLDYRIGKCCTPLPGEDIIGTVSLGNHGITIHRSDCENVMPIPIERRLPVSWNQDNKTSDNKFPIQLRIEVIDRVGVLKDCLLYTSPSPRDVEESRMPSSA